ncbi:hypothetical protein Ddc_06859 [Ditylenchus destructor]|nr:hypothetical protein Ddc_06859 [Ditylenchus destructor]
MRDFKPNIMQFTAAELSPDVSTVKTFTYKLDKFGINRSISYDLEIPPPEFLQETDLLGHLIAKENIPLPFHEDVGKALRKFITVETQKFADAISDKAVRNALSKEDTFEDISCLSAATFKCAEPSSAENIPFEECFQTVIKRSTPAQLSRIIKEEADMSEKMLALVRARDFEMDRFTRACEAAIDIVSDNDKTIEGRSYDLSVLNDKLRQVNMNYQNQIEALSESQRRMHREMIVNLFTNEDKCHSSGDKILQNPLALNRANQISASIMKKSLSCDSQMTSSHPKVSTSFRDESFTIYIGF